MIDEQMLCDLCKERPVDKSENENSVLCRECRERFIKYPFPKWLAAVSAFIIILFVISSFRLIPTMQDYRLYLDSNKKYDEGYYFDAQTGYQKLHEKYKDSIPIACKLLDSLMKQSDYYGAMNLIDESIAGKKLKSKEYEAVSAHYNKLNLLAETYNKLNEIYEKAEKLDENEKLNTINEELHKMLDNNQYDKSVILIALSGIEENIDKYISLMQEAYKEDEENTMILGYIGNAYRQKGDLLKATEMYSKALEKNKTDYISIRGMAVIELLNNNKEKALELAQKAHEISPEGMFIPETLIIALKENGKNQEMNDYIKNLEEKGYNLDAELNDYLKGKISVEDYFITRTEKKSDKN